MKKVWIAIWNFIIDVWFAFIGIKAIKGEAPKEKDMPKMHKKTNYQQQISKLKIPLMFSAYCTSNQCTQPTTNGRRKVYPSVRVGSACPHCSYPLSYRGDARSPKPNEYNVGVNTGK